MSAVIERTQKAQVAIQPKYGSEAEVEAITGLSRRTLQTHRLLGRGLPFYRFGRRVLYDLNEVENFIRSGGPHVTS
jgi:hypothetical protein